MDGYIGRVHCSYRVAGESSPGAVQSRLDRLIQSEVPEALERSLANALAGDPTVYVVRRVRAEVAVRTHASIPENRAAERIGRRFAAAIIAALAGGDPDNCATFKNHAEYVACFLRDLLRGSAWDSWIYGAFRRFRGLTLAAALEAALTESRPSLPAVLAALHRSASLPDLLRVLPPKVLQTLWSRELCAIRSDDSLLPLFTAALEILDRLAIWSQPLPDRHQLFQRWAATHRPVADWGSRSALTAIVIAVLRWIRERGLIVPVASSTVLVAEALAGMDWLETETLAEALRHPLLSSPDVPSSPETGAIPEDAAAEFLPQRSGRPAARRATPRQLTLFGHLAPLLAELRVGPDSLAIPETRIRLYALLVAAHPEWADSDIAPPLIERLLSAAAALATSLAPAEACRCLLRGDVAAALRTLPDAVVSAPRTSSAAEAASDPRAASAAHATSAAQVVAPAFRFAAEIGRPVIDLITKLAVSEHAASLESADEIETECAGLFLLLRGVVNLRVAAACHAANYGPLPPLLAALALRWAGEAALSNGGLDPAIALFSGWEGTLDDLRAAWSPVAPADHQRFHSELLRIMQSQRVPSLWPLDQTATDSAACQLLSASLASLSAAVLCLPETDSAMALTCCSVLRTWARWLRGFSESTVPFLLENFIRRPGVLVRRGTYIDVRLCPSPFDIVLELAGYLDSIPYTPGLVHIGVRFHRSRLP